MKNDNGRLTVKLERSDLEGYYYVLNAERWQFKNMDELLQVLRKSGIRDRPPSSAPDLDKPVFESQCGEPVVYVVGIETPWRLLEGKPVSEWERIAREYIA